MSRKTSNMCFHKYFKEWVELYKVGAVRNVTLEKYKMTTTRLHELAPDLLLKDLSRQSYQTLINDYATTHERQTTMDFHHQLRGSIIDAIDDGLIKNDPTRKVVIKGKQPGKKKNKFLNQFELQKLLSQLELEQKISNDWLILLIAKTGLRFSEALAITPDDFDFVHQTISVEKSWNYRTIEGGFTETKNLSSHRKISIDWKTSMQFGQLVQNLSPDEPIFVEHRVFNSTINSLLKRYCNNAGVPIISVHGLRHTHASLLLFAGVSIASVAKRLGHSNMSTTQKTYLHIIQELENQDNDKVMRYLAVL